MVIYLDVLLAVNWVIDFLLLHATARLTRTPARGGRLVLGAAVGAASCCVVLLPALPAPLSVAWKAAGACAMTAAAFRWSGVGPLLRRTAVLFVLSAAFAGAAMALWVFAAPTGLQVVNGVVYYELSPLLLIALTAVSYGLLCLVGRFMRRREPVGRAYRLRIVYHGQTAEVAALYDSGNGLVEPFSGAPVAVADYAAVAALLTPAWEPSRRTPPGARLIPYSSVGGDGFLPAFRPERLTVCGEEGEWDVSGAYVAVCGGLGGGDHGALIGTALTERKERQHVGT